MKLFERIFIFPLWVWLLGVVAWLSAEIATGSTLINAGGAAIIFSLTYYLLQVAIAADIILRRKLSILGIFLIGLLLGILEEAFYIKNPFFLTMLLAFGHAAVTVLFPYILVNFLMPFKKEPFLTRTHYLIMIPCLAALYALMAFIIPFTYFDSLVLGIISIAVLILVVVFFGGSSGVKLGRGTGILEKTAVTAIAAGLMLISQQNYLAVIVLLAWVVIRRNNLDVKDLYFSAAAFMVFHFLAAFVNKTINPVNLAADYPAALIAGVSLLIWLLFSAGFVKAAKLKVF